LFTSVLRIPSLTCCCKRFRSFVLNTLHSISLHSGWQVRSFVDASSVSDHSFPRIKQSLLRRLSFKVCFTSQPSFRSIRYTPFVLFHSITFATPQQHIAPIPLPCGFACQRTVAPLPPGRLLSHISTPQQPGSQQCFHATVFTRIPVP